MVKELELDNDVMALVEAGAIFNEEDMYIDPFEPSFESFDRGGFEDIFNSI